MRGGLSAAGEPGGGCLEGAGAAVRPEPPDLTLLPDRPTSRARCGRGMYLPSLENEIEEKEAVRGGPGLLQSRVRNDSSCSPTWCWRGTRGWFCPPSLGPRSCICPPRTGPRHSPKRLAGGTAGCSRSRWPSELLALPAGGKPQSSPSLKACWESRL